MLEGFLHLFQWRGGMLLLDILDILVVTYFIYRALLVMRGTRAMQMGMGLGVVLLARLHHHALRLGGRRHDEAAQSGQAQELVPGPVGSCRHRAGRG